MLDMYGNSILYFHLLVYIKSMLLICASPYFFFLFWKGGGRGVLLEKCSGDRTAGLPVQYHGVVFIFPLCSFFKGLVNIMQPQNCTTR